MAKKTKEPKLPAVWVKLDYDPEYTPNYWPVGVGQSRAEADEGYAQGKPKTVRYIPAPKQKGKPK
jgi:hypothetical protein